ncbi:MAG TPA: ribosome biogenesis GTPase Der [Polyangiaceae bacterium]|nr:ribosome biogenesis GTPase Der [Polyangiaceae bacterium]
MTRHFKPHGEDFAVPEEADLPLVAIVGRPNVGKSTLFNRLARRKLAIVHDEPGVTRDRHYASTLAFGTPYALVDTGGFDPEDTDPMRAGIADHVRAAIAEADVVVFVADASTELSPADRAAVDMLRRSGKPAIFVANKADSPRRDADAFDLYRLGVKEVLPVSALHGRGIGELESAIVEKLPEREPAETTAESGEPLLRVAIVGRPNAGKSSLLNRVLGENRVMVDDRPGTTRDAIDALVVRRAPAPRRGESSGTTEDHPGDKRYIFIDTAGIRRKAKVKKAEDDVEALGVLSAIRSIERAHVVVLMCDAKEGVSEQDAKILGLAEERWRALIIVLNKSDLLDKEELRKAEQQARDKISFAPWAPIVTMSAKTGRGVADLFETIDEVRAAYFFRASTGELNRFFEQVLDTRPPPTMGGRSPRLYFITQASVAPPTFVAMSNAPDSIHFSYQRYVQNQLRKRFGFGGAPVRVFYRQKRGVKLRPKTK